MAARAAKPSASEASRLHVSLKAAITWRTGDERLRQGVGAAPENVVEEEESLEQPVVAGMGCLMYRIVR